MGPEPQRQTKGMTMKKDLNYYAQKSLNPRTTKALECDLALDVDGERFHAYEVSISNQDLLFFCDKGTLNYVVDSRRGLNGPELMGIELFNVERD
jgi:uncharacterized membrane protein